MCNDHMVKPLSNEHAVASPHSPVHGIAYDENKMSRAQAAEAGLLIGLGYCSFSDYIHENFRASQSLARAQPMGMTGEEGTT